MSAAIQIIIKLSKLHHCQHWLDREHVTETEFYSRYIKDNKQMSSKHQLCWGLRCETSVDQGHVFQHYFVSSDPVPMASLSPLDTGNWWHQQACSKYALVLFARYQIFGLFTPYLLYILCESETPVWGSLVLCESCTLRVSSSSCCSSCSSQLAGGRDQREEEKQSRGGMMGWASAGCIDTRAGNEPSWSSKFHNHNHREGAFTRIY